MNRISICFAISTLAMSLGCTAARGEDGAVQQAGKVDPSAVGDGNVLSVPEACFQTMEGGEKLTLDKIKDGMATSVCYVAGHKAIYVDHPENQKHFLVLSVNELVTEKGYFQDHLYWIVEFADGADGPASALMSSTGSEIPKSRGTNGHEINVALFLDLARAEPSLLVPGTQLEVLR